MLLSGAACFLFGLVAIVSFAFDWRVAVGGGFYVPQSLIVSGVFIVAGGVLFAHGLIACDAPD